MNIEGVEEPHYDWTQAACAHCFSVHHPYALNPSRLVHPQVETCVYCGEETQDGLYVRIDPSSPEAMYPTRLK